MPYDPWQEHRRHARMVDTRKRAEAARIEAERAGAAIARARPAPWAPESEPLSLITRVGRINKT